MNNLFFLHGLEGSPQGTKSQFLRKHYPSIQIPSLSSDIFEREIILDQLIQVPSYLVGSSLGGLSSILYAQRKPEHVKGMVLLAPAVGSFDLTSKPKEVIELVQQCKIPKGIPTYIIAAKNDEVIPLESIQNLVNRSDSQDVHFQIVDDDHRLNQNLDHLLSALQKIYTSPSN
ncbi:MAG: putative alpha/beta hydrolase family esterase [bacterium]|jgi:predicted alpha/beta hydrolase family esterase